MDITYSIIRSNRKTVSLSVERDGSIIVRAPYGLADEAIHQAVEKKRHWLHEKLHHQQKYPTEARRKEFVNGESVLYLGQTYQLELIDEPMIGIEFRSGFFASRQSRNIAGRMFRDWYTQQAYRELPTRVDAFARSLGVHYNRILISDLKVRWASCTVRRTINFNWRIMKAPLLIIDYLIVHELAHLLEDNHSPRFWNTVAVQIPRYDVAKTWLRENGNLLEEDF